MKKLFKVIFLTLVLFVFLSGAICAGALTLVEDSSTAPEQGAQTGESSAAFVAPDRMLPLLVDDADLLSESEEAELLAKLEEISERQQCEIAVVTKYSIGSQTPMDYADDFFDYNGYGWGEGKEGLLLLLSMEERDYYLSGHGDFAAYAFMDAIDYTADQFLPYLKGGNYYYAFSAYADTCDDLLTRAHNGNPYRLPSGQSYFPDSGNETRDEGFPTGAAVAGGGLGSLLGFLPVSAMKSKLKSVRYQPSANTYIRPNSLDLRVSNDAFLYSQVTRVARPTNEGRTGGGGGGGFHVSSSGSSHFGGGGKF